MGVFHVFKIVQVVPNRAKYYHKFKIVYQEMLKYNLNIKSTKLRALLEKSIRHKLFITNFMNQIR